MKRLGLLFAFAMLCWSCDKDDTPSNATECDIRMKKLYESELQCTQKPTAMAVNLFSGTYEGEKVYFTDIICPACGVMPPSFGYTCAEKKITFDSYTNVKNIKLVYNSCTKEYVD
ncbi:hypothetical protein SAMN05660206_101150 [Sphingobacterium wenxiniae]|uniref:Uncharacterized protein n=2 Tax=Sphingobacterium wenxiniae TaxID=683125 RepID=A0A1I6NWT9_9SPHI|nr:hypothetical protein SAMN05660206_101150 [Sphingobacterium wenxiniae]